MGVHLDADQMLSSSELRQLKSGAEAYPFADDEAKVVYKLFNLRGTENLETPQGWLGKRVIMVERGDDELEVVLSEATLTDTLEKLIILNDAGGHPTEIVGLSDDGNFMIAKQPFALPYVDFKNDRRIAVEAIKAVIPSFTRLNREIGVFWLRDQAWMICDLHNGNIMRSRENKPTIIDALIGRLPASVSGKVPWARDALEDSRALRLNLPKIVRKSFGEDVDDDEL
ncbi:hypothetical protein JIN84_10825 [Luteolibacter yonseiensis]|uniref:Uncharacterized protein n=1 Tax=Luteolibacter yonseiensis TaxID=1144680 RepID=A0A934R4H3_9BACT|nr:hypothetical protein [Luteolibacter yonseiensis]MBK1816106.1 hypothetical protein [Luteolibacter yonseiensis]